MGGKRVIITGATGMVGGCALRICLGNPAVSLVTVIGRSRMGINDARLREAVVDDFIDYSAVTDTLANQETALYCLGAYTGAVPDDRFRQITLDDTLAFAKALKRVSPQAAFCFLSGQGADQTGQSRMAFARYQGAAESRLSPNIGISPDGLAAAMVHAGLQGSGEKGHPLHEGGMIRLLKMAFLQFETLNSGRDHEGGLRCFIEKCQKTGTNFQCSDTDVCGSR